MTILLVDDNVKITRMICRRLAKSGHQIHIAEDGKEGVEKALELSPDLILMDMQMSVMNGYQAVKLLRAQNYNGLIAAFTASITADDLDKAMQAGCDTYIAKPVGLDFEERIRNLLEEKPEIKDRENGEDIDCR